MQVEFLTWNLRPYLHAEIWFNQWQWKGPLTSYHPATKQWLIPGPECGCRQGFISFGPHLANRFSIAIPFEQSDRYQIL